MDWKARLEHELISVYGAERGTPLARALAVRADEQKHRAGPSGFDDPAEALLITYGDQVTRPGEAPLSVLRSFLGLRARGLVSGVHVLPFYPWSSDDGFAVKDFLAVDPALGTWSDVRDLGRDFDLMADAVFNHASVQGEWFARFREDAEGFGEFFTTMEGDPDLTAVVRPRALPLLTEFATARGPRRVWTTFSSDQADLNFRESDVMRALSEVLLFYLAQGVRYIRLDAIGFIWKEPGTSCLHLPPAHALVRAWRALAEGAAPGARLVTETNVPHADNISYFGDGHNEAHMVYNFALPPLVLHTLRTGDASVLTGWAAGLTVPSPDTTFFNFLASHDGIGLNPARGLLPEKDIAALVDLAHRAGGYAGQKTMPDGSQAPYELNVNYFDALAVGCDDATAVRRFTVAHAMAFALAGVPGLYFHSLFGSRGDRPGAESSGIPRRINRQKFEADTLAGELDDPGSLRHRLHANLAGLLRRRASCAAFAPSAPQRVIDAGPGLFVVERGHPGEAMLCLHEVAGQHQEYAGQNLEPYEVRWIPVLS
ncbi:MAG: sugar phosphorylase [Chthoniobacterales bacterium]